MKTKDLIKLLKEMDPSGELQVMTLEGAIIHLESKPGYWDGPCHYLEDGKYKINDKDEKIVISSTDYEDFIWAHDGDYSNIELNVGDSKKADYIARFKRESEEAVKWFESAMATSLKDIDKRLKIGVRIIQHSNCKGFMSYIEMGKFKITEDTELILQRKKADDKISKKYGMNHLCQGEQKAVLKSGLYEKKKINDTLYEWVYRF